MRDYKKVVRMIESLLCSNCFNDQGLRLDASRIGIDSDDTCPNCKTKNGKKLNKELIEILTQRFFVRGTLHKCEYGAAPVIQFNEYHYKNREVNISEWLKNDVILIEEAIKVGFFYYGPRLWMVGEIEPLKSLERATERNEIIQRILREYPVRVITNKETFYRLRKAPDDPSNYDEYDSPPNHFLEKGRLDSVKLPILYGSQDLEVCIHECRVTIEDELFIASLSPTGDLKLLDLTELLHEDTTEFESLDLAIHMLFLAGEHSYEISRDIAFAAYNAGYDGLIYPSYYSLVRTGAMPFRTVYGLSVRKYFSSSEQAKSEIIQNIALFGRPIKRGIVAVKCINKLLLSREAYDVHFGPVDYQ
jgi:hypothetical protein